jgi:hypothetical protein
MGLVAIHVRMFEVTENRGGAHRLGGGVGKQDALAMSPRGLHAHLTEVPRRRKALARIASSLFLRCFFSVALLRSSIVGRAGRISACLTKSVSIAALLPCGRAWPASSIWCCGWGRRSASRTPSSTRRPASGQQVEQARCLVVCPHDRCDRRPRPERPPIGFRVQAAPRIDFDETRLYPARLLQVLHQSEDCRMLNARGHDLITALLSFERRENGPMRSGTPKSAACAVQDWAVICGATWCASPCPGKALSSGNR